MWLDPAGQSSEQAVWSLLLLSRKRERLLQSFLLPGGYFIPKMTPGYAPGGSEKARCSRESPDFGQPAPSSLKVGSLSAAAMAQGQNHPTGHRMRLVAVSDCIPVFISFSLVLLEMKYSH